MVFATSPLPIEEPERLVELHDYKILDTPPEVAFDRLTHMTARPFGMTVLADLCLQVERESAALEHRAVLGRLKEGLAGIKSCVSQQNPAWLEQGT
jgi:hypothetical protein